VPADSVELKVRRDKRPGPDGTEKPFAATAYEGEVRVGGGRDPGLVLSRGIRCCPRLWREERWRMAEGHRVPVDRSRASCAAFERRIVAPAVRDHLALTSPSGLSDVSRGSL